MWRGIGSGDYGMRCGDSPGKWAEILWGISSITVCFLSFNPELRYTSTIELNGGRMSGVEWTGDW